MKQKNGADLKSSVPERDPRGTFFFSTYYFLGKLQIWFRGKCKRSNLCSSSVPLLKSPLGPRTAVSGGGLVEGDGLGGGLAAYYEKAFGASFGKTSHHISDRLHKQKIKFYISKSLGT